MGNILDYLKWRGDLTFAERPFNEVDNLILSYLSYVNYVGILCGDVDTLPLSEASSAFFRMHSKEELTKDHSFIRRAPSVLREAALTARYRDVILCHYIHRINTDAVLQFSALEFQLPDGSSYISYQGTDDTIVGWKEDFEISLGTVPAQQMALQYLQRAAGEGSRPLYVGGHSKGGNLAVYASAMCSPDIQSRIRDVYSNDGPGFSGSFLFEPGLARITPRIHRFLPEFSIFGCLMKQPGAPILLKSNESGVMQHDGLSWQVQGAGFIPAEELSPTAVIITDSITAWLDSIPLEERSSFIDDFFSVFEATDCHTLTELHDGGFATIRSIFNNRNLLHPSTRELIERLFRCIAVQASENALNDLRSLFSTKAPEDSQSAHAGGSL